MPEAGTDILDTIREAYEAFNRGDFDSAVEFAHPQVELVRPAQQAPIVGVEALRRWMEPDAFEHQRNEPLSFERNGDRVLVHQRTHARGAGSGIEIDVEAWSVWTVGEGGRIIRIEYFLPHQEDAARAAAGLGDTG